jgi:hypothetical protein
MANTFKVKTDAAAPASAGTFDTVYTVPSSTTSIVLGLMVCNVKTSQVTASVRLNTNTVDTETNQTVLLVQDVPIPVGSSVELLAGNKVVMQTTDFLEIDCDTTAGVDVTLSIMEIT